MSKSINEILSAKEIEALATEILEEFREGREEAAGVKLQQLRGIQRHQLEAAMSVLRIVQEHILPVDEAAAIASEIVHAHPQDVGLLSAVGECLEAARDIDDLNAAPPAEQVFQTVVERLTGLARDYAGRKEEEVILRGLATSARMLARQCDVVAESSYRRLAEINPQSSTAHYNLGLFFKTRGRFEDGMKSNDTAARLSDEEIESYEWNLGICATGAGNGAVALDVWKRMGQKIEMGRFGLPEGSYPQCKVKLAERPLAERTAADDAPGLEETIWIQRLSPCHGIIRSVLYQDLGVDYGDVILIDGAPITYHSYGETKVPVFPHLTTLIRRNYQFFDFAGTQEETGQLADASIDLDDDCVVYAHSENYRELCATCWRDPNVDHEEHETMERHVVTGRIAVPGHIVPDHLLDQLDKAVAKRRPCQLYAPDLCAAAGLEDRALVDQRRFELLTNN